MILDPPLVFAATPVAVLAAAAVVFRYRSDAPAAFLRAPFSGRGRLPRPVQQAIQREGIRHLEEGLRIDVTVNGDFQGTGQRSWVGTGAVAVTPRRLVAHLRSHRVLNVPFDPSGASPLRARREGPDGVCLIVDATAINPRSRGNVEYRFRTPAADRFTDMIRTATVDPMARWHQTGRISEFV